MSARCPYMTTTYGLRFKEGQLRVELLDEDGQRIEYEVVTSRNNVSQERNDRRQELGLLPQVAMNELKEMMEPGDVVYTTVILGEEVLSEAAIDPYAARGRRGRQNAMDGSYNNVAEMFEQVLGLGENGPDIAFALACNQLENLPRGKPQKIPGGKTEIEAARLPKTALPHLTAITQAVGETTAQLYLKHGQNVDGLIDITSKLEVPAALLAYDAMIAADPRTMQLFPRDELRKMANLGNTTEQWQLEQVREARAALENKDRMLKSEISDCEKGLDTTRGNLTAAKKLLEAREQQNESAQVAHQAALTDLESTKQNLVDVEDGPQNIEHEAGVRRDEAIEKIKADLRVHAAKSGVIRPGPRDEVDNAYLEMFPSYQAEIAKAESAYLAEVAQGKLAWRTQLEDAKMAVAQAETREEKARAVGLQAQEKVMEARPEVEKQEDLLRAQQENMAVLQQELEQNSRPLNEFRQQENRLNQVVALHDDAMREAFGTSLPRGTKFIDEGAAIVATAVHNKDVVENQVLRYRPHTRDGVDVANTPFDELVQMGHETFSHIPNAELMDVDLLSVEHEKWLQTRLGTIDAELVNVNGKDYDIARIRPADLPPAVVNRLPYNTSQRATQRDFQAWQETLRDSSGKIPSQYVTVQGTAYDIATTPPGELPASVIPHLPYTKSTVPSDQEYEQWREARRRRFAPPKMVEVPDGKNGTVTVDAANTLFEQMPPAYQHRMQSGYAIEVVDMVLSVKHKNDGAPPPRPSQRLALDLGEERAREVCASVAHYVSPAFDGTPVRNVERKGVYTKWRNRQVGFLGRLFNDRKDYSKGAQLVQDNKGHWYIKLADGKTVIDSHGLSYNGLFDLAAEAIERNRKLLNHQR